MIVFDPTIEYNSKDYFSEIKLFLAGSIEQGKADNWQDKLIYSLSDLEDEYLIFNPRRKDWKSNWNKIKNHPQLIRQINWELNRLEEADIIAMYFDPKTTSLISLLELGKFVDDKKIILFCPEEYIRYENVYVTFKKYRRDWEYYFCRTWKEFASKIKSELLFINTI